MKETFQSLIAELEIKKKEIAGCDTSLETDIYNNPLLCCGEKDANNLGHYKGKAWCTFCYFYITDLEIRIESYKKAQKMVEEFYNDFVLTSHCSKDLKLFQQKYEYYFEKKELGI